MKRKTLNQNHFYLVFPKSFGFKGGVEVYSAFLLQAWQELYPEANYDVFLKYSDSASKDLGNFPCLPQTRFHSISPQVYESSPWRGLLIISLSVAKILALGIQQRPTLMVLSEANKYTLACDWLKRLTKVPYWVFVYGYDAWNIQNSPTKKVALRHADRIVSCSSYTRDRLIREGNFDPAQISVLPCTFDESQFQIKPKPDYLLERYGLSAQQPVIFTVTRIEGASRYKGYDKVLKALPKIRQQIPNLRYILAGKGDDRTRIEYLISTLNLQDSVTLAGFIPEDELCDHYNLCDLFAMPSKGEGFGIVYLEAMACGKPVLAGNKDGSVDPLAHGELGCLVNPDDGDAIAHNIIQILQGTYPNSLMYQPEQLRKKTIEMFGFIQFRKTLEKLMQNFQEN